MKTYCVITQGYERQCWPEFKTKAGALVELKLMVKESLNKARRRGHRQATKHKISDDCYRVTLGRDKDSTLYAHHSIACN